MGEVRNEITDREAIRAAGYLKEYCASHEVCNGCAFRYPNEYRICGLVSPPIWDIPDQAPAETKDSKRIREREEFFRGGAAW